MRDKEMNKTELEVYFCLNMQDGNCVSEVDSIMDFDLYAADIRVNEYLEGAIVIQLVGLPTIMVRDPLLYTINQVCFISLADLMANRNVSISYFASSGYLHLNPQGDTIVISGDFVPTIQAPKDSLIRALFGCGDRFIAFYKQLKGNQSAYEANILNLEHNAQLAKVSLPH